MYQCQLKTVFMDESGSPSAAHPSSHLVVAAIVVDEPRAIELHVRRARRALRQRAASGELKASNADTRVVRRMLAALAGEPCEIFAVVAEKAAFAGRDAEEAYRETVTRAVALVAALHPRLRIVIDRRYTNPRQQLALEEKIRNALASTPEQVVLIIQADSAETPGLQAVDFVAWAIARWAAGEGAWLEPLWPRVATLEVVGARK
jgi:hypothetical protein